MLKTNKVVWQKEAVVQIKEIRRFISKDSKKAASKVVKKIKVSVDRLEKYSFIGQEEEYLKQVFKEVRYLVVGSYKVIYRFENQIVYILAVFDTRRNPSSLENEISKE